MAQVTVYVDEYLPAEDREWEGLDERIWFEIRDEVGGDKEYEITDKIDEIMYVLDFEEKQDAIKEWISWHEKELGEEIGIVLEIELERWDGGHEHKTVVLK